MLRTKVRTGFAIVLVAAAISCGDRERKRPGGARLEVLFDERHGLEGSEPVRLHDFEVGQVEKVDLAGARVRAILSIEPDVLAQLTKETTVSVESEGSSRYLEIHVLDPGAPALAEGDAIDGVDSGLELTYRRASAEANGWLERFGSAEWATEARDLLRDVEREVGETDWKGKRDEVEERLGDARREIERAAGETASEARKSYELVRKELDRIVEELERAGRSEEAEKLREEIENLFHDLTTIGRDDQGERR